MKYSFQIKLIGSHFKLPIVKTKGSNEIVIVKTQAISKFVWWYISSQLFQMLS